VVAGAEDDEDSVDDEAEVVGTELVLDSVLVAVELLLEGVTLEEPSLELEGPSSFGSGAAPELIRSMRLPWGAGALFLMMRLRCACSRS